MVPVDEKLNKQLYDINSLKGNVPDICNKISRDVRNDLNSLVQEGAIFYINAGTAGRLQDAYKGIGTNTRGGRTPTSLRENLETALTDKTTLHRTLTAALTAGRTPPPAIAQELRQVNSEITSIRAAIGTTANLYNIYSNLSWIAEHFKTGGLSNVANTVQYNTGGMNFQTHTGTLDLDTDFNGITTTTLTTPPHLNDKGYSLCDENDKELTKVTTGTPAITTYQIKIDGQDYTIGGIIDPIANPLDLSHVTINPTPKTFPLNLKLSIKKTYEATVNGKTMNFVHTKPLNLSITEAAATLPVLSTVYPRFSTTTVTARRRTGNDLLNETYLHNKELWEKSAYQKFFSEGPKKAKYDALSPEQKQILMERVKAWQAEVFTTRNQIFARDTDMQSIFEQYVTKNENIPEENRRTENDYKNYLITNYSSLLEKSCKEYYAEVLSKGPLITPILTPTSPHGHSYRDELDQIFATFLQDLENGKIDNENIHLEAINVLERRPNRKNNHRKGIKEHKMAALNRKRMDYRNIISGKSADIKDQTFDYIDEEGNSQNTTYNVHLSCPDANHFEIKIIIRGKENYPLNFIAPSPDDLINTILETSMTGDREPLNCKLRVRMVLSTLKALIAMCPGTEERKNYHILERNCTAVRGYDRIGVETDESGNLKIVATNFKKVGRRPRYIAKTLVLFNEKNFMQLNDDSLLKEGIGRVAGEIMRQLNNQAKETRDVIDTGLFKRRSKTCKNYSRISRLRKMVNLRKNTNLSYETSTTKSGITIQFNDKTNRYTLTKGDYKITGRDIGKMLYDKHFNGNQLEIFSANHRAQLENMLEKDDTLSTRCFMVNAGSITGTAKQYVFYNNTVYSCDPLMYNGKASLQEGKAQEVPFSTISRGFQVCTPEEKENFFNNPNLAGKIVKCMRGKMKFRTKAQEDDKTIKFYSGASLAA